MNDSRLIGPFLLQARFVARVWGGTRLQAGEPSIGEAWIVHEANLILTGHFSGKTLEEVATLLGPDLLGEPVFESGERRFPLLIKLLDTAEWLSIQVHPDDQLAEALEGPGHRGKTEAWHILDAAPGAELIAGLVPGVTRAKAEEAILRGHLEPLLRHLSVGTGDSFLIPAGTLHALGPGLFLYEVQQSSDLTYRVFDWDRPASAGRALHLEESIAAARAGYTVERIPFPPLDDGSAVLVRSPYFVLELVAGRAEVQRNTFQRSFHAVTAIRGSIRLETAYGLLTIGALETAIVPAAVGSYSLQSSGSFQALIASVP